MIGRLRDVARRLIDPKNKVVRREPTTPPLDPAATAVDLSEVARWEAAGEAPLLVDIRDPAEIEEGFPEGAWLMPSDVADTKLYKLPKDQRVLVLCAAGGHSAQVAAHLRRAGNPRACSLRGGVGAWTEGGRPLRKVSGDGPRRLLEAVRLREDVVAERGLEGGDRPLPGTIQDIHRRGRGWRYTLRLTDKFGRSLRVEDVRPDELVAPARPPR